jgi:hypothetical protein
MTERAAARMEPLRDIVLLMPESVAVVFQVQVKELQKVYGTTTILSTVRRAVAESLERARADGTWTPT